jgi:hypothetical protein
MAPYESYCKRGHRRSEYPCPTCKKDWDRYYELKALAEKERDLAKLTSMMLEVLAEAAREQ